PGRVEPGPVAAGADAASAGTGSAGTAAPRHSPPGRAHSAGRPPPGPGPAADPVRRLLPPLADRCQPGPDRAPARSPLRDGGHLATRLPPGGCPGPKGLRSLAAGAPEVPECLWRAGHPGACLPDRRLAEPGPA